MTYLPYFLFSLFVFFSGCTPQRQCEEVITCPGELVSICLIDREGLSEAIANPERLRQFENVNFLNPQPYQKVLRVFSRDSAGASRAYITTYHPNGYIKQYLEIVNSRAFGIYREWFANGQMKVEALVMEGSPDISLAAEKTWIFDGVAKAWDEKGNLVAEIPYCRGVQQGTAFYYHPNKALWKKIPFENNLVSGVVEYFKENGELLQTLTYCNGEREGESIRYWTPTDMASQEFYEQGRLVSGVYFSCSGEKIAEIIHGDGKRVIFGKDGVSEIHTYQHGFPEGAVTVFDTRGRESKIYHVKNGAKHGEELIFYPLLGKEKRPKLSVSWYQGKIRGINRTWYETGQMESQREMSDNKKNGMCTAWYRDGSLMLIEEYDDEKLVKGDYFKRGDRHPVSQVFNGEGIVTFFDPEGNYLKKVKYTQGKPED